MRFYTKISPEIIVIILVAFAIFLFLNGMGINDIFNEIFNLILRR
uniref:Preprotein translocase subunit SecE n=1 Tax=Dulem virus 59 TaxID=3145770 RepID=A0AAU8B7Z4_9VIRU